MAKQARKPYGYWKIEANIKAAASECATLKEFQKKYATAYRISRELGIANDLGLKRGHVPNGHWEIEANVRNAASECVSIKEFQKKFPSACKAATKLGITDDLGLKRAQVSAGHWEIEANIKAAASECATLKEFVQRFGAAVHRAREMGIIHDLGFERTIMPNGHWEIEANVRNAASECVSIKEFQNTFVSAYKYACKVGIIDDLGLERGVSGFNPKMPAILYYLKVKHRGHTYYKVGITNRTINLRYSNEDQKKIEVLKILNYKIGRNCFKREQAIIKEHAKHLYKGKATPLLGAKGNAELFTCDIMGLP